MDVMLIRQAIPEDALFIARCIIMAEGEMIPFLTGHDDLEMAREKLGGWILSSVPNRYSLEHTLVAEEDGNPVAAAISFPADAQPELDTLILEDVRRRGRDLDKLFLEGIPGTYYLSTMGVEPVYRKQGIGTALMIASENRARSLGFARTSLLVDTEKPRVKELYERMGHVAAEEVTLANCTYCRMAHTL